MSKDSGIPRLQTWGAVKQDYKLISKNAYRPQGEELPSIWQCIGCALAGVISTLVIAYAFIGYAMGY